MKEIFLQFFYAKMLFIKTSKLCESLHDDSSKKKNQRHANYPLNIPLKRKGANDDKIQLLTLLSEAYSRNVKGQRIKVERCAKILLRSRKFRQIRQSGIQYGKPRAS